MQIAKKYRIIPTEFDECRWFYHWTQTIGKLKKKVIHHANEGKRAAHTGHRLKLIGLQPGLLDYQIIKANPLYHSLWIEMKTRDKKKHRKNPLQDAWIAELLSEGHYATYAYGWNDAANIVLDYLANKL